MLQNGVDAWNQWRRSCPDEFPDLSNCDLQAASLSKINFRNANLRGANLSDSTLCSANLSNAPMEGAHLVGADLTYADFSDARLDGAFLTGARLSDAVFRRTKLARTDWHGAMIGFTIFAGVNLDGVQGLETVIHRAPSSIGVETIYLSKGRIPIEFLRGAGLSDDFIEYIPALMTAPSAFYSCFISYSFSDQEFAEKLYVDLQSAGVHCWFAAHDMRGGDKVFEQIRHAIHLHNRLLLILSETSMASEWVKSEIALARNREAIEGRRVLFPVRLVDFETLREWTCFDADREKDSAREIREYFVVDFSQWRNEASYQWAFERLLNDLKSENGMGNDQDVHPAWIPPW